MEGRSTHWDVLVVGAGPAGASTARAAAERGATVLLLDKAHFPRYKTCGGGLIGFSRQYLPPGTEKTIDHEVAEIGFSLRMGKVVRHTQSEPALGMVHREEFDQANVDAAVAAGAVFRDGVNVRSVNQNQNLVTTVTDHETFTSGVVVGADGAGGRVGRYVGVELAHIDLGLELELPLPKTGDWKKSILIDWGPSSGSYAWVFPKSNRLVVGVIEAKGEHQRTRKYLDQWISRLGLDVTGACRESGHLTQSRVPGSSVRRGRVILAGETGGFLDPWTREGISFALRSGTWAGEYAALRGSDENALEKYERHVCERLDPEVAAGAKILDLFERHPGAVYAYTAHTKLGVSSFFGYCRGTVTLPNVVQNQPVRALLQIAGLRARGK